MPLNRIMRQTNPRTPWMVMEEARRELKALGADVFIAVGYGGQMAWRADGSIPWAIGALVTVVPVLQQRLIQGP